MEYAVKRFAILLAVVVLVGIVSAFKFLELQAVKGLDRVGIPADMVKSCIWNSIAGGYLSYPSITNLKRVATGDRVAITRDIAAFAKAYTKTEEFKKQYLEYRDSKKPEPPEKPKTAAELRKTQKEELQKGLKEAEANYRKAPANQREIFKGVVDMYKEQLKQVDDPSNPMFSGDMDAMMQQGYLQQLEEHKTQVAEWEKAWPTDPTHMIKKWLTEFLEVSKDIDYTAAVKPGEFGKSVFVKAEYESKPGNWKMCYRAGRDVVSAGRSAAQQWLNELR
jgi:hypothetical protein